MHKITLNDSFTSFRDFILNIQIQFNNNSRTIHKARNELKIITYQNIETIVKSFKTPNLLRRIIYTYFRDSKAKKSYDNSVKLQNFTPEPIAYIEFFQNGLINESYFISEKFEYDFTIREPLLDDAFEDKEEILRAFSRFSLELHNQGIFHDDYSPGNILIKKENDTFVFKVVDINRMKFFNLQEDDRAKSFSKLWARDDELEIIANEYAKEYTCSSNFSKQVCHYSNQNKKIKNFKKRLKGKPVND